MTAKCPSCGEVGVDVKGRGTAACPACGGAFTALAHVFASLKRAGVDGPRLQEILGREGKKLLPCVSCSELFMTFPVLGEQLHACVPCQAVWLRKGALDRFIAMDSAHGGPVSTATMTMAIANVSPPAPPSPASTPPAPPPLAPPPALASVPSMAASMPPAWSPPPMAPRSSAPMGSPSDAIPLPGAPPPAPPPFPPAPTGSSTISMFAVSTPFPAAPSPAMPPLAPLPPPPFAPPAPPAQPPASHTATMAFAGVPSTLLSTPVAPRASAFVASLDPPIPGGDALDPPMPRSGSLDPPVAAAKPPPAVRSSSSSGPSPPSPRSSSAGPSPPSPPSPRASSSSGPSPPSPRSTALDPEEPSDKMRKSEGRKPERLEKPRDDKGDKKPKRPEAGSLYVPGSSGGSPALRALLVIALLGGVGFAGYRLFGPAPTTGIGGGKGAAFGRSAAVTVEPLALRGRPATRLTSKQGGGDFLAWYIPGGGSADAGTGELLLVEILGKDLKLDGLPRRLGDLAVMSGDVTIDGKAGRLRGFFTEKDAWVLAVTSSTPNFGRTREAERFLSSFASQ